MFIALYVDFDSCPSSTPGLLLFSVGKTIVCADREADKDLLWSGREGRVSDEAEILTDIWRRVYSRHQLQIVIILRYKQFLYN